MTRLAILDRDGTINVDRADYVKSVDELILIPHAAQAIRQIQQMGFKVVVATNQSCIGKGIITEIQLNKIHQHLQNLLAQEHAAIDKFYVAPDHPDRPTDRRKPGCGMLAEAMRDFNATPENTVMIGDALRDIEAAHSAQCHKILVKTGLGWDAFKCGIPKHLEPVHIVDSLFESIGIVRQIYETQKKEVL